MGSWRSETQVRVALARLEGPLTSTVAFAPLAWPLAAAAVEPLPSPPLLPLPLAASLAQRRARDSSALAMSGRPCSTRGSRGTAAAAALGMLTTSSSPADATATTGASGEKADDDLDDDGR